MSTASICKPFASASTHFGAKNERTASFRLKKLYIASEGATHAQCTEGGRNTNEWNAHFHPIEAWLLDRRITSSAERFTKFALKIRDLCAESLADGGDGWVHIGELRGALRKKRPFSASWVDKAKRPLLALGIIDVRPGYVLYLGAPPCERRFKSISGKLSGYRRAQNRSFKASQPAERGAVALIGNAEGERHAARHANRNAQGRFAPANPKQTKGASPPKTCLDAEPKRRPEAWEAWGYCPSRVRKGPVPPCPVTPDEIDKLDAELERQADCLKNKQKAPMPEQPAMPVALEAEPASCNGHSRIGGAFGAPDKGPCPEAPQAVVEAFRGPEDAGGAVDETERDLRQASVTQDVPGRFEPDALPDYMRSAFAAFRAKAVPEPHDEPAPKRRGVEPNRPLPKPRPDIVPSSNLIRSRVVRGPAPTQAWLRDVFDGTRYADLRFAAVRHLGLDCNALLAARSLCDGRKGITENWSGMLVAAAKRLQTGQWLMLGSAREPHG